VLVFVPLVLALVLGIAAGGKLGNLAYVRFRWPWFVLAVLVIRIAVLQTPLDHIDGLQYLYAASQAGLVVWSAWHIKRLPAVWLVTIGAAMNTIVILANGARMPVTPEMAAALVHRGHQAEYVVMGPGTALNWLGDSIVFPWPVPGAYSPGDLILAVGIGITVLLVITHHPAAGTKLDET
jgi:uncharacterized protein DUF5317